jgi:hypothetical protein
MAASEPRRWQPRQYLRTFAACSVSAGGEVHGSPGEHDESGVGTIDNSGGLQEMTLISESGLDFLILASRKQRSLAGATLDPA